MGFLDRAIKREISKGIGKAVGQAVGKAIEPKAEELANRAAQKIDSATPSKTVSVPAQSSTPAAFANLERAAQGFVTERTKNMKQCPACAEFTTADKKFCPHCGEKLPEGTVADSLVCTACGSQNNVGTKFCQQCGAKLPFAIAEEQAQLSKDEAVLNEFREYLPQYPVWNCGGKNFCLERDSEYCWFSARFEDYNRARAAVEQYKQLLLQNGFRQAGQYPSSDQLFKKVDGVCYNADTEHCFDGDSDCPTIYFAMREPTGGFDYVKPEPKKKSSLFDLFK